MPNIHGALLHVPKPPPKGRFRATGERIASGAKSAFGPRARRARASGRAFTGNMSSRRGQQVGEGRKFGRSNPEDVSEVRERRLTNFNAGTMGLALGAVGGSTLTAGSAGRSQQIARNKSQISRNNKKLSKRFGLRGEPVHLITNVGTRAERMENKAHSAHHPGYWGMGGMAVGGGTVGAGAIGARKHQKQTLKTQKTTLAAQRGKLRAQTGVTKMDSTSAFGVDHGQIEKFDYGTKKAPSTGRKASAALFGGAHGAVAGRKGKKLRAFGNETVGGAVGSTAGSMAGTLGAAALTRGRSMGAMHGASLAGSLGGGYYGVQRGLARNTRKGYLKPEK